MITSNRKKMSQFYCWQFLGLDKHLRTHTIKRTNIVCYSIENVHNEISFHYKQTTNISNVIYWIVDSLTINKSTNKQKQEEWEKPHRNHDDKCNEWMKNSKTKQNKTENFQNNKWFTYRLYLSKNKLLFFDENFSR